MAYDKLVTVRTAVTRTTTVNLETGIEWEQESRSTRVTTRDKAFDLEILHDIIVQALRPK